ERGCRGGEGGPTGLSRVATASAAKWHAPQGMYLIWGNGVPAKPGHAGKGDVHQVAATLLALAGMAPGRDVNGDPLDGAAPVNLPRADYAAQFHPAGRAPSARGATDREAIA